MGRCERTLCTPPGYGPELQHGTFVHHNVLLKILLLIKFYFFFVKLTFPKSIDQLQQQGMGMYGQVRQTGMGAFNQMRQQGMGALGQAQSMGQQGLQQVRLQMWQSVQCR